MARQRDNQQEIMSKLWQSMQKIGGETAIGQEFLNYQGIMQQNLHPNLYNNLSGFSPQQLAEPQPLPYPQVKDEESLAEDHYDPFPYPTIESCRDRERAVIEFKFKCVECEGYVHLTKNNKKYCIAYQLEEPVVLCDERV